MADQKGMTEFEHRGFRAAKAFLENRGLTVLNELFETEHGTIPIIAADSGTIVHVTVETIKATGEGIPEPEPGDIGTRMAQMAEYRSKMRFSLPVRFDHIMIYAFSETQALLRYVRGIVDEFQPGYEPECEDCDSNEKTTDENGTSHECVASDCLHLHEN